MSNENIRRHRRIPYTGPVRVSWQSADGPRYALGACMDVSEAGLRIEVPESIPLHTVVSLSAERLKISGSATVRHVARRGLKWLVGLELNAALLEKVWVAATEALETARAKS